MKSYSRTFKTEVTWDLSFFLKEIDILVSNVVLPINDDKDVRELLGYDENESLNGEHPVSKESAKKIQQKYNVTCDVIKYDIFLGAREPD